MAGTVKKVSLAIGREEFAWAERRARRDGTSVSAVLTAAARSALEEEAREERRRAAWAEVEAWVTQGKPITEEEIADVRRELDGAGARLPERGKRRGRRSRRVA